MPNGGTLTVETANVELPLEPHPGEAAGPHVLLTVRDTGVGISRDVQERLFEPFYSTKEGGKGTGLGLAIVYGIVNQSGGSIVVESAPNRGAVFKIFLPRDESAGETPGHGRAMTEACVAGTETILLVEDQDVVREVTAEILVRHGYTVIAAASGHDALLAANQHHGPIDLLLTDVVMPELSSNDVAEHLLRYHPGARVLFMSGYIGADRLSCPDVSAQRAGFIQKPFSPSALLRTLRTMFSPRHEA